MSRKGAALGSLPWDSLNLRGLFTQSIGWHIKFETALRSDHLTHSAFLFYKTMVKVSGHTSPPHPHPVLDKTMPSIWKRHGECQSTDNDS